jgi:putative Ca2+/H+ antiporter (TMEM165/GDT1 family)
MEAFFISAGIVAIGEIGDKTQLLAMILAARFKRPVPIILGILVATLANHALAGLLGAWVRTTVPAEYLRWGLGLSFLAVAAWALIPDKMDEGEAKAPARFGVFTVTVIAFFLAEIGDKTQVATAMLAARFDALVAVVAGTTAGMLIADIPAVLLGGAASPRIPFKLVRYVAAALFAVLGLAALLGLG